MFPDKTRLPNHKNMEKARLETFTLGKGWAHDKTKNHGANSKSVTIFLLFCIPRPSLRTIPYRWHAQALLIPPTNPEMTLHLVSTVMFHWAAGMKTTTQCTQFSSYKYYKLHKLNHIDREEHRKRATKSDTNCPFFEPTEPRRTRSKSKPPSAPTAKRRATSHKRTASRSKPKSPEVEPEQPTTIEPAPLFVPKQKPGKTPKAKASKVVEVSSDEEEVEKKVSPKSFETKTRIIEPIESSGPSSLRAAKDSEQPSLGMRQPVRDDTDISMHDAEPGIQETVTDTEQKLHTAPSTPPRPILQEKSNHSGRSNAPQSIPQTFNDTTAPSTPPRPVLHEEEPNHSDRSDGPQSILQTSDGTSAVAQPSSPPADTNPPPTTEPLYLPPLSRLPFMPLQTLSEAELDMTVEEWIRYQIEVEQDRFKRDGERELERFKKRAEEVRKAIDDL